MSSELMKVGAPAITNMDDLARVSEMFAKSRMFRDSQDAAQAGVKILCGLESGFGAFAAMSGVHVIEGKASIGANLMALAIKRSGKYNYRVLEHTETSCVVEIYERWDGAWQSVGKSSFTIEDAKAAGVRFKDLKNNPTPWAKFPRNMLFSRAVSNAVRWYCPDCMNVTVYAAEELGAEVDGEGNVIQAEIVEPETAPETPAPVVPTVVTPAAGDTVEPAPVAADAVWMAWRKADDPVLWAVHQTDAEGAALFNHHSHAQASFNKAKDEYSNSLTDAEKPKADDSHEVKWKHARALFKYFFERTEAKKKGETLVLPTAGSQRIFEPFAADEAIDAKELAGV